MNKDEFNKEMKNRTKGKVFTPPQEVVMGGGHHLCGICGETLFGSALHYCKEKDTLCTVCGGGGKYIYPLGPKSILKDCPNCEGTGRVPVIEINKTMKDIASLDLVKSAEQFVERIKDGTIKNRHTTTICKEKIKMNKPQFTEEQFNKMMVESSICEYITPDNYLRLTNNMKDKGYIIPVKKEEPLIVGNVMSYKGKNYLRQLGDCMRCAFYQIECHTGIDIIKFEDKTNCLGTNSIWKSFDDIIIDDNLACSRKDIGDIYLKGALDDPFILCKIQEDEAIIHLPRTMDRFRTQSTPKEHLRLATAEELQEYFKEK